MRITSEKIKKVAAIHASCGYGRASLGIVTPILSSMGVQVCPVPTSVLSSHTGFENVSFVDLTETLKEYFEQWKNLNLEFNCLYSGFLSSSKQIDAISHYINHIKNDNTLIVIDPVMGDSGNLYRTINEKLLENMKNYIKLADIITPNYTEAAFLLNKEYNKDISLEEIKKWTIALSELGPKYVVITSVPDNNNNYTNIVLYNKISNEFYNKRIKKIPISFPGTGDAFTSILIGCILRGINFKEAIIISSDFLSKVIKESYKANLPTKEGILIEKYLPELNEKIQ
ncbi:pyridoxamine kinase [Clostridium sediminicola]|uniref:pyridoxamine kinase n=1 Tax=Clostridium sediminicola TaxID=3114879 RepID=UPI0031F2493F